MGDLTRGKTLPDSADKADFHDLIDDTTIAADKITAAMIKDGVVSEAKLDVTSAPQTHYVMAYNGTKMDWYNQLSLLSISDSLTDQSVKTTASPSFVGLNVTSLASLAEIKTTYVDVGSLASLANINVVNINGSAYSSKTFGNWSLIGSLASTPRQVSSDGFVTANIQWVSGSDAYKALLGYTDSNATPTTLRVSCTAGETHPGTAQCDMNYGSFTMPVKSGDYWKIDESELNAGGTYTITINWIPQA